MSHALLLLLLRCRAGWKQLCVAPTRERWADKAAAVISRFIGPFWNHTRIPNIHKSKQKNTAKYFPPPTPSEWLRLRPGKSLIVLISARQMIVFPLHLFDCFYFNLKWHVRYILICRAVLWRLLHCNINEVISPPTGLQIWRLTVADCVKIYFFLFFPAIVISRSSCKQSVIISDGKPRAAVWVIMWYLLQKVNWSCWSVQREDWFDEKHFRCFWRCSFDDQFFGGILL